MKSFVAATLFTFIIGVLAAPTAPDATATASEAVTPTGTGEAVTPTVAAPSLEPATPSEPSDGGSPAATAAASPEELAVIGDKYITMLKNNGFSEADIKTMFAADGILSAMPVAGSLLGSILGPLLGGAKGSKGGDAGPLGGITGTLGNTVGGLTGGAKGGK